MFDAFCRGCALVTGMVVTAALFYALIAIALGLGPQ